MWYQDKAESYHTYNPIEYGEDSGYDLLLSGLRI